jgi:hypothetical protein
MAWRCAGRALGVISGYLAEHEVTIRCGFYTWQLEVDGELMYDGWPPRFRWGFTCPSDHL